MLSDLLLSVVIFSVGTALVLVGSKLNSLASQQEKQTNAVLQLVSTIGLLSKKLDDLESHLRDQDTISKVQVHDLQQIKTRLTASKKREKKLLKKGKRGRS